ncbi:MAG TPA: hypothetical protein ENK14_06450 [Caldithrix sp.]|nr:hypothetical protein [Caldithrix sp.]
MLKKCFVSFIILILFTGFQVIRAQATAQAAGETNQQEVIAKGVGAIIGGDEAKAEDDAKANALRNAVEQVIGTMVQSDVLVQNYQTIEDNIYSHTSGYVQSYDVIGKSKRGENILEVTIRAVVKKGDLKNNLEAIGVLMSRKGKPRVMVLVDEKNMSAHYYSWAVDMNTTETEIMNVMMEKGFRFVDKNIAMQKIKKDMVLAAIGGDPMAAASIGTQTGAEVLIIGKAASKAASGGPAVLRQAGMVSCQATLNLRAVRADDGSIIATTSQQAASAHIDRLTGGTMALKRAAEAAAQELSAKIIDRWQKDIYSSTTINLRLLDVTSFSDLIKFKNMLPVMVRGVQKVYQRDYSNNTALFDLDVKSNATKVAEEMATKDFSPLKIEIVNVTQNTIVAKMVKTY